MTYKRNERVGDLLKKEIASMISLGEIKDPRIGFITITHVEMTPDLKEAKVYFSQIGTDADKDKSRNGLNNASGFIRRNLARRLDLKHIPTIQFLFDDSIEYSERIGRVIKELKDKEGSGNL